MRLREKLRMAEEKASECPVGPLHVCMAHNIFLQRTLVLFVCTGPSLLRVVIVGGGYSGVELACNLANRLGRDRCVSACHVSHRAAETYKMGHVRLSQEEAFFAMVL